MQTRRRWNKQIVLDSIRLRAEARKPLNYSAVVRDDEPLVGAARRVFGGWDQALAAASIDPQTVKNPQESKASPGTWDESTILAQIRLHAERGDDLAAHRMQKTNTALVSSATSHFGSWRAAIAATGFDYGEIRLRRQWPKEQIIQRLKKIAANGGDLSYLTAEAWDCGFVAAAVAVFGDWDKALEAAGVEPQRRTVRWSRSRVIQAIQGGATASCNAGLLRASQAVFGSWEAARQAAGVTRDVPVPVHCYARRYRTQCGLSLEEVGRRLGYSHRTISMIELGQVPDPRVSTALKLAKVLKVPVEQLFKLPRAKPSRVSE